MRAQESHYILDDAADAHDGETMRQRFKPASQAHSTSLKSPSESSNSHNRSSRPTKRGKLPPRRGQARDGLSHGILRRSWAPPLVLVLFFLCLYAINPSESNAVSHFLFLSYRIDSHDDSGSTRAPAQYGKGPWDIAFVCFYTIFLSFTREFTMQEVLRRLAHACGIRSRAKQSRFMEQMYTACYVAFIGPLGLYVMKRTPGLWYFETRGMYESYPHRTHGAVFKFYYLFQAAFWAQQVLVMVLGQEKRRKDFKEFVAHHMVTVSLIWLSYRFHFTYAGIAIYITHDISDFFLAISKSLNYIDHPLQASTFALCIAAWIYLRHYINLIVLYSVATEFSTIGPFELDWGAQQYKCRISQVVMLGLLAGLQTLNLFWLYCLFRSAYRYIVTGVAKDDRSEAEES